MTNNTDKSDNDGMINIFMGLPDEVKRVKLTGGTEMVKYRPMKYSSSWEALMPVVEKIYKLYSEAFPTNEKFIEMIMAHEDPIDRHYTDVVSMPMSTPLDEAYESVVTFIKWHNSQSKQAQS